MQFSDGLVVIMFDLINVQRFTHALRVREGTKDLPIAGTDYRRALVFIHGILLYLVQTPTHPQRTIALPTTLMHLALLFVHLTALY